MFTAIITFERGAKPQQFTFQFVDDQAPWRFIGDEGSVALGPLCDREGFTVFKLPFFEHLDIWPLRWGYPAEFDREHASEVEELKRRFEAGEFSKPGPWSRGRNRKRT